MLDWENGMNRRDEWHTSLHQCWCVTKGIYKGVLFLLEKSVTCATSWGRLAYIYVQAKNRQIFFLLFLRALQQLSTQLFFININSRMRSVGRSTHQTNSHLLHSNPNS